MTIRERILYKQVKEMWIKGFTIKFTSQTYEFINTIKIHEVIEESLLTGKTYTKHYDLQGVCDVFAKCIQCGATLEYTK